MADIWYPPESLVENSNVKRFMVKHGFKSYKDLVQKSVEDVDWFWSKAEEELGVEWFQPYTKVLDTSRGVQWAKWFINGRMNVAHNALDKHAASEAKDWVAFIWAGEDGSIERYTYSELYREANRLANELEGLGVGVGDPVALLLPMIPETVVSLFAILKVGAIVLPIFSGLGPPAIATRLRRSGAKVLITVDGTHRRGRVIRIKEDLDEAAEEAPELEKVIVIKRIGIDVPWKEGRDIVWDDALASQSSEYDTKQVDPEHPALFLYTSGTTGRPKGAIISHAGALLQSAKEIHFNMDLKPREVLMWITDIGWMMGPWQIIGAQSLGGTHVIFEGTINYPKPDRVWAMIERLGITHLGGSATAFRMLKSLGDEWVKTHDLSSLRVTGNTGEPIDPDTWTWLMETVGEGRCPLINLSGGTEIFGCFLLPLPVMPLKPSTLGGPGLGMAIDVFNDGGESIRGEVGYLVCKKPAPSMTRGFWKENERYIETYWSRWPGVWFHGDWASVDEDGYWFLHGRTDDVIKVAGKRLGPAEVESIINENKAVRESACIGLPHELKGEVLVCFVALKPGYEPSPELEEEIRGLIVGSMGKPFAPQDVILVRDLPRNRAGKIMRRIVKALMLGREPEDLSVVENFEALDEIRRAARSST
jgi:acetyl-CoA synthetase